MRKATLAFAVSFRRLLVRWTHSSFSTVKSVPERPGDLTLKDFIKGSLAATKDASGSRFTNSDGISYLPRHLMDGRGRKVFFKVYGCQMNVNDTEIAWSILKDHGYERTTQEADADVVLLVTCSIREGAEQKIRSCLVHLQALKERKRANRQPFTVGVLGCMAERLKHHLIEEEKMVDVVCGPDAYRDLPRLLVLGESTEVAVNVLLSLEETYADVTPVRLNPNSISAFVTVMRGCDNMCSYCIVPFTRGRERSRPAMSIVEEVQRLVNDGVKEVTLLGQNVNSYCDTSKPRSKEETQMSHGFSAFYKPKRGGIRFAELLERVARVDAELRVRFTSPHPKDFPDEVLDVIRSYPNICKSLHIPAQSGSTGVLERMRRGYSREAYLDLISHVRTLLPGVALSSDFICGFCGETEEEFQDTVSLIQSVRYNTAFLFPFSMRQKTRAYHRMQDDVPEVVKKARLEKMVAVFRQGALELHQELIGSLQLVLVEGVSKRSIDCLAGRSDGNTRVVFPQMVVPVDGTSICQTMKPGDYVAIKACSIIFLLTIGELIPK
ncbi:unnamed protein product [Darwinula stevensoni]|uniref:CDK5RAP1-like protein n=1 Tax=Darwinula stevensoni TaxID=69355 RepID=A0A7R9A320_9CRUS|nr:unnamed protein product [Darwinula stevensoni]CAG0886893.1 unnamed protein product [Darwinula stevensoni]